MRALNFAFSTIAMIAAAGWLPPAVAEASGDRLVAGGTVVQETAVGGDFMGFGGEVEILAPVTGDVVAGGGTVRLRGAVGGDVHAAGGTVVAEGAVNGDVRLAGGQVELLGSGRVGGDLAAAGGEVLILGPVTGAVHAAGGSVLIDAEVGGDVSVASGGLELGPNARIAGKLRYRGPDEIRRHPDARVAGGTQRTTRERPPPVERTRERSTFAGGWLWTLGLVALAALLAAAFPGATRRLGGELRAQPGLTFLLGFVALIGVPFLALMLMISVIGLPVAALLLLLYFGVLLVGYAAIAVVLGDTALARYKAPSASRTGWRVAAAMAAMLALGLLGRVPFLGGLVVLAVLLAGIGAIVMALRPGRAAPAA